MKTLLQAFSAHAAFLAVSAASLGSYNVNPSTVSVSGLSAGGYMAGQLGVAYSGTFATGFGVFAAGPFDCARNQYYFSCMNNAVPSIAQPTANMKAWSGNQIDPVENLKSRQVYLEVGSADTTVGPNPMKQLQQQLSGFTDASRVSYILTNGAGHTFPTDFDGAGDNACGQSTSPYISNCQYDGAGEVLKWMYGGLSPRNTGTLSGQVLGFDQTGSFGAPGLDNAGYVYVPKSCQDGASCKLHVALHGCLQSHGHIGLKYVENTGYNLWADTNNIIVLYPQAVVDYTIHQIFGGTVLSNPNACFDWVGWYGNDADQKGGAQMAAIVAQVKQITSAFVG